MANAEHDSNAENDSNGCWAVFYKNKDQDEDGKKASFSGPGEKDDLSSIKWDGDSSDSNQDNKYSSLKVGPNCWLEVFSDTNKDGSSLLFYPSSTDPVCKNLDQAQISTLNSWDKSISSFRLTDYPAFDLNAIVDKFKALFTDEHEDIDTGSNFKFTTQGGTFEISNPVLSQDSGIVNFQINLTHDRSSNDYATVTFSMNQSGEIVNQMKITYDMGSAIEIPDWVVNLADTVIDDSEKAIKLVLDVSEEVVSEGLLTEAIPITNELVSKAASAASFVINHINAICKAIYKLEEDGNSQYFSSVVAHAINRMIAAFIEQCVEQGTITNSDDEKKLSINDSDIIPLINTNEQDYTNDPTSDNKYVRFQQSTVNDDQYPFRMWQPESSSGYMASGLMSSCKIDNVRQGLEPNDYLVLNTILSPTGVLIGMQGAIVNHNTTDNSDYVPPSSGLIVAQTTTDENGINTVTINQLTKNSNGDDIITALPQTSIEDAYLNQMNETLAAASQYVVFDSATQNLAAASIDVVNALSQSCEIISW